MLRHLFASCLLLAAAAAPAHEAQPWPKAQPSPELSLIDAQGHTWKLADLRGKPVLINFWASWCEPCRAELPSLQTIFDLYGGQLVVLAVNFKERGERATQFMRAAGLSLPTPLDRDGAAAKEWGVKIFPTSILVDAEGRVRWRITGEVDWSGREAAGWIEPLLK